MKILLPFCVFKTTIKISKQIKDCETNLRKEAERSERWTGNALVSGPARPDR